VLVYRNDGGCRYCSGGRLYVGQPKKPTRRRRVARGRKAKRLHVDGMGGGNLGKDLNTILPRPIVCDREKKRNGYPIEFLYFNWSLELSSYILTGHSN
jgi:hypothetical protein